MKKELLNESEIRKMMKFANLQPLTTPFINKLEEGGMMGAAYQKDDEEGDPDMVDDPAMGAMGDAPGEMGPEPDAMDAAPEEAPEPDMADEPAMGGEEAGEEVTWSLSAEQAKIIAPVMDDLAAQVRDMAGEDEGEADMAMDDEPAEEEEPEGMMAEETEALEEEDTLEEENLYVSEGAGSDLQKVNIVNEVARRVAQRLIKARRKKTNKK